jgi:hypothetical protein
MILQLIFFGLLICCNLMPQVSKTNITINKDQLEARRRELIIHGGLRAACTYADFISFRQYKANLHCHSLHSDGSQYCDSVASWYIKHGYQVLAITDHDAYGDQDGGAKYLYSKKFQSDTVVHDWDGDGLMHPAWEYRSGVEAYVRDYSKPSPVWVPRNWQLERPGQFIILNGLESSFGHEHFNSINAPAGSIARPREGYGFIDRCHNNKGLVFINHMAGWNNRPNKIFDNPDIRRIDGLEVMNGFLSRDNRDGKNPDGSPGFAEPLWDGCLNAGRRMWGFANDDAHTTDTLHFAGSGSAWNMIWSDNLTRSSIMEALRAGAFYASCGVLVNRLNITSDAITVSSPNATHIKVIADCGRTVMQVYASSATYVLKGDEKWIRIVLWNDIVCYPLEKPKFTQKAWLQPIMLDNLLTTIK